MRTQWIAPLLMLGGCAQDPGSPEHFRQAIALVRQCIKPPELPRLFERRYPDVNIVQVTLEYELLPAHRVGPVEVRSSTGYPELDAAAVRAIQEWSCATATPLREPIRLRQTFTYRLNGTAGGLEEEVEGWPPANVSLQWYGRYAATASARVAIGSNDIAKRKPTIEGVVPVSGTEQVKATLGTNFGISYIFDAPPPRTFVNHRVVWKFPEGGFVHGYSGNRVYSLIRDKTCKIGAQCVAGWTFDNDWEQVAGTWTVELWLDDKLSVSRSFEVVLP